MPRSFAPKNACGIFCVGDDVFAHAGPFRGSREMRPCSIRTAQHDICPHEFVRNRHLGSLLADVAFLVLSRILR